MKVNLGFDRDQLERVVEAVKNTPDAGKTVWKASTQWRDGFRSEAIIPREGPPATHTPGPSHTVSMDEPTLLGGSDTAPNMVEMVLGAYGCCLTTGFVANAALRGIQLERVEIELEGDLDLRSFFGLEDPEVVSPGYTEVRAKIRLEAPDATTEQLRELHEHVVSTSPVGNIISRPVKVNAQLAHT
jgi:uncharacterized OsmC-like protein